VNRTAGDRGRYSGPRLPAGVVDEQEEVPPLPSPVLGLDEAPWITLDPSITAVICVAFVIGVAVVVRDLVWGKGPAMENRPLSGDTSLPIEPAIWHHAG